MRHEGSYGWPSYFSLILALSVPDSTPPPFCPFGDACLFRLALESITSYGVPQVGTVLSRELNPVSTLHPLPLPFWQHLLILLSAGKYYIIRCSPSGNRSEPGIEPCIALLLNVSSTTESIQRRIGSVVELTFKHLLNVSSTTEPI